MTRINTNIDALRGLNNLNKSQKAQTQSLTRLSTGLQINSGRDNPSGLIASDKLQLQTTTIQQSVANSNRANNVLSTADSALGEIGGLLNQVRGLVQEGLNVGALSADETQANQQQIDAALSAINRISANTSFAGDKLIDGSKAFNFTTSQADTPKLSQVSVGAALLGGASSLALNTTVTQVAAKASLQYTDGALTSATTLDLGGVSGRQTVSLGAGSTVQTVADAVNNVTSSTGVSARIVSGYSKNQAAAANTLTTGTAGGNNSLIFTDARATGDLGSNASLGGSVSINYVNAVGSTSVAVTTDANNNKLVTVTGNALTATAFQTAVQQNAAASALVTVSSAGGTGASAVGAISSVALTGGNDRNVLSFTDKRTTGSAGNVNVVFAGGASQTFGISVATSGNDSTITVQLATDANSNVTATSNNQLKNILTSLQGNTAANGLVGLTLRGDGNQYASTLASTTLATTTGTLYLESSQYGAAQTVSVNTLGGSFTTAKSDGTIANSANGQDIKAIINGQTAQGVGLTASVNTSTVTAALTFSTAGNVLNNTATVNINGGGALFQIGQEVNSSGQVGVGIDAVNTTRLGNAASKLFQLGTGQGSSLIDIRNGLTGAGPKVDASNVVDVLNQAINQVSALRGRIGALQKNVIDTNISTLGVALENITDARSQIVDTDFASESASQQRASILSQAGISVLSLANQRPQSVLALLRQ